MLQFLWLLLSLVVVILITMMETSGSVGFKYVAGMTLGAWLYWTSSILFH